jgi:hypothetical protein
VSFIYRRLLKPDICNCFTLSPGSIHNHLTFPELSYTSASPPTESMAPGDRFIISFPNQRSIMLTTLDPTS